MSRTDDRIICNHCGKRITPKLSFRYGEPHHSWCPYCKKRVDDECDPTALLVLMALVASLFYIFF